MTTISIDDTRFMIDGEPTYVDREYHGKPIEGLLFNSRMVQAIFDDDCAETRKHWRYPDSGEWDPERNTDEFCAMLPEYHKRGLRAVTVGLQGGGSIYRPDVYNSYINSAFAPDGELKEAYFQRLRRILHAADACGMVVIVNYFYFKQAARLERERVIKDVTEATTDWLLGTGRRNVLVDVANEAGPQWRHEICQANGVHRLIDIVKSTTLNGRRLLASASTLGGKQLPTDKWLAAEDFSLPHGNGLTPQELREKIRQLRRKKEYAVRPRPVLINEDSVFVDNLKTAVDEYTSWGFYCQGYGSDYKDRMDWTTQERERRVEVLSGYQTLPVNWGINTPIKRAFFDAVQEITGS